MTNIANVDDIKEQTWGEGGLGHAYKALTPSMRPSGGTLGASYNRLAPGKAAAPFHWHALEDEVFFILEGRGVLRYGDTVSPLRKGDCVSCPAGTKVAHQIANPHDVDLVYLAIGPHHPHEVCGYPDTGKINVRTVDSVGRLAAGAYFAGEPQPPRVFDLIAASSGELEGED